MRGQSRRHFEQSRQTRRYLLRQLRERPQILNERNSRLLSCWPRWSCASVSRRLFGMAVYLPKKSRRTLRLTPSISTKSRVGTRRMKTPFLLRSPW